MCPTGALEICGNKYTISEILSVVEKDIAFYGDLGGVTISGGEPFAQKESTVALLKACKEKGVHTVVETCGYADADALCAAIPFVDLFLWDIKDTDDERHKKYTGVPTQMIWDNLVLADASGANTRLRCILINGINTNEAHYHKIAKIASSLSHCEGVEWIPYHAYGGAKNMFLGGWDSGRKEWIPTPEQMEKAKEIVKSADVNLF
jgi:pyruvate formate lyase activating enzyme